MSFICEVELRYPASERGRRGWRPGGLPRRGRPPPSRTPVKSLNSLQLLPQNLHGGKSGDPYALLFGECAHGAGHGSVIKFGDARLCTMAVVADMFKGDGVQGYDESFGWAAELFAAACSSGADHQKRNQAEGSANFNIYGLAGPSALKQA